MTIAIGGTSACPRAWRSWRAADGELGAGVVLGAHGACTDDDDVGQLAHQRNSARSPGPPRRAGLAVDGGGAVEAG